MLGGVKVFPIMLDVRGRRCVVVGGGRVGVRKAAALLDAGADVTLVAESIAEDAPDGAELVPRAWRPEDLDDAALVFACTDDRAANAAIAAEARRRGVLVNAADQPDDCDFHLPACIRRGDVVVAVATGASAPALSGELRDRLAPHVPERIGEFAAALADLRDELRSRVDDPRRRHEIMRALAGAASCDAFVREGPAALCRRLREAIDDG